MNAVAVLIYIGCIATIMTSVPTVRHVAFWRSEQRPDHHVVMQRKL